MSDKRRRLLKEYFQALIQERVFSIKEPPDVIGKKIGTAIISDSKWALSDLGLEAAGRGISMLGDLAKGYAGMAADLIGSFRDVASRRK